MKITNLEVLSADAGWRNYYFLKITTDDGIAGWSEFDEGFGSPGITAVIERLAPRIVGQRVFDHERVYAELYCLTRPAAGGVVAEGLGAIENALLDAKAKALGVPCHVLLGVVEAVVEHVGHVLVAEAVGRLHLDALRDARRAFLGRDSLP